MDEDISRAIDLLRDTANVEGLEDHAAEAYERVKEASDAHERLRLATGAFLVLIRDRGLGRFMPDELPLLNAMAGAVKASPPPGAPLTEPDKGRKNGAAGEEVPQDARTGPAACAPPSGSVSVSPPPGERAPREASDKKPSDAGEAET